MNKTIIIAIILAVVAGASIFLISQTKQENNNSQVVPSENTLATQSNIGRYIEYSKSALDQAQEKKRVFYFYASWCSTCRPADESFRNNEDKIPKDVVVMRVNYNDTETDQEEKELAKKYNITYQHTFVQIDSQGNEVAKWNGGQIDELLKNIK